VSKAWGPVILELIPAITFFTNNDDFFGGKTLEQDPRGLTTALCLSRYQSIKLSGSTGVYNRTENSFWAVGAAWQYRWGGGL
jgi:hypothetical protein